MWLIEIAAGGILIFGYKAHIGVDQDSSVEAGAQPSLARRPRPTRARSPTR